MNGKRRFSKLRFALFNQGITQQELGSAIGRSQSYVSSRFRGVEDWTTGDIFKICDYAQIPTSQIFEYFFEQEIQRIERK